MTLLNVLIAFVFGRANLLRVIIVKLVYCGKTWLIYPPNGQIYAKASKRAVLVEAKEGSVRDEGRNFGLDPFSDWRLHLFFFFDVDLGSFLPLFKCLSFLYPSFLRIYFFLLHKFLKILRFGSFSFHGELSAECNSQSLPTPLLLMQHARNGTCTAIRVRHNSKRF